MVFVFRLCTLNISWDCPPKTSKTLNYSLLFAGVAQWNWASTSHATPAPASHPSYFHVRSFTAHDGQRAPAPHERDDGPTSTHVSGGSHGPGSQFGGPITAHVLGLFASHGVMNQIARKNLRILPSYYKFLMVDGVYVNMKLGAKNLAGFLTFLTVWHFSVRWL